MILTRAAIQARRACGDIVIEPFHGSQLNPNSYNCRLGHELLIYPLGPGEALDMRREPPERRMEIGPQGFVLQPGQLYLAETEEYTETRNLVPMLEGRSGIGRLGLSVHVTAGVGDVGFCGTWTLELTVTHPLRVYAGVAVCQLIYHTLEGQPEPYRGSYQDQRGPQPSRLWKELERPASR